MSGMFPVISNVADDLDTHLFQDYANPLAENEHNNDNENNDYDAPSSNIYDTTQEMSSSPSQPETSQHEDIKFDQYFMQQSQSLPELFFEQSEFQLKTEPLEPSAEMPMLNDAVDTAAEATEEVAHEVADYMAVDFNINSFSVDEVLLRAEAQVLENRSLLESVNEQNSSSALTGGGRGSIIQFNLLDDDPDTIVDAPGHEPHFVYHLDDDTVPPSIDLSIPASVERPTHNSSPQPLVTLEISDGDDDDDVIFVCQSAGNHVPVIVDLCDSLPTSPTEVLPVNLPAASAASTSSNGAENAAFGSIAEADAAIRNGMFQIHSELQRRVNNTLDTTEIHRRLQREVAELTARNEADAVAAAEAIQAAENRKISCAVCLDSPFSNRPSATVCGHVFCGPCIRQALLATKKCPLCNRKISARQVHALYV